MAIKRRPPKGNVRRVKNSGKNIRGTIVSQAGETVQRESSEERKHLLILFRNKKYVRVISQPMVIPYTDSNRKPHKYTPDAQTISRDGQIEIHEFTLTKREKANLEREAGARKFCAENGYTYIVHTEKDLPSSTELANLDVLFCYRASCYLDDTIRKMVLDLLHEKQKMKIVDLVNVLSKKLNLSEGDINNTVFHMLWYEELSTDMEQLLLLDGEPNWKVNIWKNENQG